MDRLVNCDSEVDFIREKSPKNIWLKGVLRKFVGLEIFVDRFIGSNDVRWAIYVKSNRVRYVTLVIYSVRLNKNIALAMVLEGMSALGPDLEVDDGIMSSKCIVVQKPCYDLQKILAVNGW